MRAVLSLACTYEFVAMDRLAFCAWGSSPHDAADEIYLYEEQYIAAI